MSAQIGGTPGTTGTGSFASRPSRSANVGGGATTPRHPMLHGRPVMLGDLILYEGFLYDRTGTLDSGIVEEVRWIEHRDEYWIHVREHPNLCIVPGNVREIVRSAFPGSLPAVYAPELPALHMSSEGPLGPAAIRRARREGTSVVHYGESLCSWIWENGVVTAPECYVTQDIRLVTCQFCWEDMK